MGQLMTNHCANATEVHGIVGLIVIKRRLEDPRWKCDVVELGIVAGIDRTRRIRPIIFVYRLADLIQISLEIEFIGPPRIT